MYLPNLTIEIVVIMFSQLPEEEHNISLQNNPHRRRVKSFKNKNKRKGKRKAPNKKQSSTHFATLTMSAWAENFTHAATWQLKHQIAYWKSKATALQYENQLLHDIIRKNYLNNTHKETVPKENEDVIVQESQSSSEEEDENEDLEVSEEFIQFLMDNAKYKEDAMRERERLKASNNAEQDLIKELEAMPTKSTEDKQTTLKNLYGENWQKVAALETALQSQFLNECDREKPEYWPNIPLNFNFK